eukprot:TRINITY_DN3921_c0_g2_i1.p1 TRINITY_DN3921_c0_g2~~TRINITY_DN3921_c0_g2_i1.p1  ORF type:complete len:258 (+),score=70.51 TRINITY_DN3921_c0_g2_i1:1204-1977(+)
MITSVGTACYVAPEVLSGRSYGTTCDIWSCGVIAYILLSGQMPFHGSGNEEIFEKIKAAQYTFPSPYFDYVSIEGLDFIDKILVPNLYLRMSLQQCLEHPWMRKWHSDLQKKYFEKTKCKSSKKKQSPERERDKEREKDKVKYKEKLVSPVAAEQKTSTRPAKDSIAPQDIYADEDDDGFPPITGLPPIAEQPQEPPPDLPEMVSPLPLTTPSPPSSTQDESSHNEKVKTKRAKSSEKKRRSLSNPRKMGKSSPVTH